MGSGQLLWSVQFASRRVERQWRRLEARAPEAAKRCLHHLQESPMQRVPGRVYPWRGEGSGGRWEYEVDGGDRVIYLPSPSDRTVTIIYAGEHPKEYR